MYEHEQMKQTKNTLLWIMNAGQNTFQATTWKKKLQTTSKVDLHVSKKASPQCCTTLKYTSTYPSNTVQLNLTSTNLLQGWKLLRYPVFTRLTTTSSSNTTTQLNMHTGNSMKINPNISTLVIFIYFLSIDGYSNLNSYFYQFPKTLK